jgi:broad specificity phosphatase PhoE
MAEVWMVRHGQGISNAGLPTGLPADSGLTETGRLQAGAVAVSLPGPPDLIVVSAYVRAVDTARPTMERFPDSPVETAPVHEFTYLSPGRYAGTTREDRHPMIRDYWERCDPAYRDGEGAETFAELAARVEAFFARFVESGDTGGLTVVFTHGQFLRAVLLRFFGGFGADAAAMARFRGSGRPLRWETPPSCA